MNQGVKLTESKRKKNIKHRVREILLFLIGITIVVILLFPVYWIVATSLKSNSEIFGNPTLIPMNPTIEAYKITFFEQLGYIKTSLIISFGTVIFSLLIALPTAYALAKFRFKSTNVILLAILIVQMVPNIMMTTPLYLIFSNLNLLNTHFGLILADSTYAIPFIVLILRTVFMNIPDELIEAAYIDGAGEFKTFIKVIIPVSYSGIITGALFAFLFSWGDFIYALTLTTDESIRPITLGIYNFIGQYTENWNQLMAASVIAIVPVTILLILFQKYITAGLTDGSTKG